MPLLGKVGRAAIFASASACWTSTTSGPPNTPVRNGVASEGSGSAQTDEVLIPAPGTGFASIGGIATDSATGQPLANVNIQIYPESGQGTQWAKSDAQGHYAVTDLPPGKYGLQFKGPGDPGRMAPETHYVELRAGDRKRLDAPVDNRDWSNIPMPYGAPPMRRRVV
jgi:hypothetical protein